nr:ECF transporter S component [Candidatus Sigynarchaeum springense]
MPGKLINFKTQPSKTFALTGIFAALFALGNFIAIPGVTSHEHVVTFVCATLFGPYVAVISSVIGEIIVAPFSKLFWLPSTLIGDILTALIVGYGRNFAFYLQKRHEMQPVKARRIAESTFFIIAVCGRYITYLTIDAALISAGLDIGNTLLGFFLFVFLPAWVYKIAWTPLCVLIVDQMRRYLNVVYYDKPDLVDAFKNRG